MSAAMPATTTAPALADALASLYDAAAVRTPPWMALVTALASIRPDGVAATIDWLVAHRAALIAADAAGRAAPLALPEVPPEMRYPAELGAMDLATRQHRVRARSLFDELVGRRSFFQNAVYAITGVELTAADGTMLDDIGSANLLLDRRAWPMAVTRRIAARGGGYAAAMLGGTAMLGAPVLAGAAAGDCARFLRRADVAAREGQPVEALVADLLARRQRVMGFGRPLVGPDERVPVMAATLARHGRDDGRFVTLLRAADEAFWQHKGLRSTSAAWAAAILSDLGLSPDAVQAVSNYWVTVNLAAQALFSHERGLVTP
ncbi:MAG: hypothetical protein JNK64_06900 [Myxococcales bacterium]|nr:hypothetical protein [Myxococcales bacterium]